MLKAGHIIKDENDDLIVCSTKEFGNILYAYIMNDTTKEFGFYKVDIQEDTYNLELVEDEKKLQELILIFAKDYIEKNPEVVKKIENITNLEEEDELN